MEENLIYLPTLKQVKIINYSLYNRDIVYNFIDGINLVVGGNGVGKTTFINIIKYALIGLYKKDLIVRNYGGEKRFFRKTYTNCNTYFRTRMEEEKNDETACVELEFYVKDILFYVKRSLYDTKLEEAYFIQNGEINYIDGEVIRQDYYSKFENADEDEKEKYLQYNYEKILAEKINVSDFNDVIFFVNQILLFNESRNTVLWKEDVQNRLFSNYLNNPKLEKKRKDLSFESKYQDSISRHKQEEIKAINKVLREIVKRDNKEYSDADKVKLFSSIDNCEKKIYSIENGRKDLQKKISELYRDVALISKNINEKEKEKNKLEVSNRNNYWIGVNSKYSIYKRQYIGNHICPMCNSHIETVSGDRIDRCFFCNSQITVDPSLVKAVDEVNASLNELMEKRRSIEQIIAKYEDEIKELDSEFRKTKVELFEKKNELRALEGRNDADTSETEASYIAMLKRIEQLQEEKDNASDLSEKYRNECTNIINDIEKNMLEITRNISNLFSDFAEAFLRVKCYLTLDFGESNKTKIFIPVIDGRARYDEEELSESQRFFVDYSFRMSIMSYFYQCPTFYICETPDSSLDISYEENAVDTFMKFLEQPNILIITSNLNNSTFIKTLMEKGKKINVINLLKYGRISNVQESNAALIKLSEEIEVLANE